MSGIKLENHVGNHGRIVFFKEAVTGGEHLMDHVSKSLLVTSFRRPVQARLNGRILEFQFEQRTLKPQPRRSFRGNLTPSCRPQLEANKPVLLPGFLRVVLLSEGVAVGNGESFLLHGILRT